eukprot:TRINITY_DN663_c0_g1_i11.p1 TRINITY_DN663_c0_g1~~TRINITY_DN663_c0_g1_i11.p1  ORF type:complete len:520 (-),score=96.55 TRINITY_DN663_c0_g1_i11:1092-2651(-)
MYKNIDADALFKELKQQPDNNNCFECAMPSPNWASVPFGIFICKSCAGRHRGLGVHLSFVRSPSMDVWDQNQLMHMKFGGNSACKSFFDAHGISQIKDLNEKYSSDVATLYRDRLNSIVESRIKLEEKNRVVESQSTGPAFQSQFAFPMAASNSPNVPRPFQPLGTQIQFQHRIEPLSTPKAQSPLTTPLTASYGAAVEPKPNEGTSTSPYISLAHPINYDNSTKFVPTPQPTYSNSPKTEPRSFPSTENTPTSSNTIMIPNTESTLSYSGGGKTSSSDSSGSYSSLYSMLESNNPSTLTTYDTTTANTTDNSNTPVYTYGSLSYQSSTPSSSATSTYTAPPSATSASTTPPSSTTLYTAPSNSASSTAPSSAQSSVVFTATPSTYVSYTSTSNTYTPSSGTNTTKLELDHMEFGDPNLHVDDSNQPDAIRHEIDDEDMGDPSSILWGSPQIPTTYNHQQQPQQSQPIYNQQEYTTDYSQQKFQYPTPNYQVSAQAYQNYQIDPNDPAAQAKAQKCIIS